VWFLEDMALAFTHLMVFSVLSLPVIGFYYFSWIYYAEFSLKEPRDNVSYLDTKYSFFRIPS